MAKTNSRPRGCSAVGFPKIFAPMLRSSVRALCFPRPSQPHRRRADAGRGFDKDHLPAMVAGTTLSAFEWTIANAVAVPTPTLRAWEQGLYEPAAERKRRLEAKMEEHQLSICPSLGSLSRLCAKICRCARN
jgi:hypothetical protein